MHSSSFQTENCWMYLGRQDIRYWPYLWRVSACGRYLSALFMTGARNSPIAIKIEKRRQEY